MTETSAQTVSPVSLDVLATGYPSLDYIFQVSRSPGPDETAIVYQLPEQYTFGGCGANVAVGLARLGFRASVATVVGDDPPGCDYIRYLDEHGVDTADVLVWRGAPTSQSYLFLNPDGDCQTFFYPGAADAWQGELRLKHLSHSRAALLTVGAPHYSRAFIDRVLEAGVPLIWQLKADVYSYPPEQLDRLARTSRLLIMNRVEANYLAEALGGPPSHFGLGIADCGMNNPKSEIRNPKSEEGRGGWRRLLRDEAQLIVITYGTAGSLVIDAAGEYEVPIVRPPQVVDPTGAGDAYTAGFLAGWLRGFPPAVCGRLAATLASFAVEKIGCQTNLPDWISLASRYREHFGEPLGR